MMKIKKISMPKILLCILLVFVALVVLVFGTLTITEFRPAASEDLVIENESSKVLHQGDSFDIMTWNVGYCGLGENADFFMDGGKSVQSSDKEMVSNNIDMISRHLQEISPDIVFLQEVDTSSNRSYYTDEKAAFSSVLPGYNNTYAINYKVLYVPYPLPAIGKVEGGIVTFSSYDVTSSTRLSLPCPFKYPIRLANLKRCLMVNRIPIDGTDKELVLVNLHLEAYDDGEGKAAQTAQLKNLLAQEVDKGNYVIAGGDFNQVFSNIDTSAYPLISEDFWTPGAIDTKSFDSRLSFVTDPTYPTCRSLDKPIADAQRDYDKFQYYVIDGFIVSDNLAINFVHTMDYQFENTDHNPVVMEVTLL